MYTGTNYGLHPADVGVSACVCVCVKIKWVMRFPSSAKTLCEYFISNHYECMCLSKSWHSESRRKTNEISVDYFHSWVTLNNFKHKWKTHFLCSNKLISDVTNGWWVMHSNANWCFKTTFRRSVTINNEPSVKAVINSLLSCSAHNK